MTKIWYHITIWIAIILWVACIVLALLDMFHAAFVDMLILGVYVAIMDGKWKSVYHGGYTEKTSIVTINNRLDPTVELFDYNGNSVGKIRNNAAWLDVCAQIHTKRLDGYYVKFKGEKIIISKNGGVKNVPPGFYDSCDISLDKLLDLN